MDVVGSEIGQKMRSAIKAKLTELGCYVDDELPDYVMVMVANKRTRAQMEDDLQLFLGDNTELFVNWLHQVLKKLQEVTVTAPIKVAEPEKVKESSSKEKKSKDKDKKDKDKTKKAESSKKSKKKDKEKTHKKKEAKKVHKSKKKSKKHEMIRPNIPPMLMNMEKESEPSITDVFAGQILKNHGITLDTPKIDPKVDAKPIPELKRPILPIIDPATINSQPEPSQSSMESIATISDPDIEEVTPAIPPATAPRDEQIKEMNEIEAKIQGLKQKLAEQLDSMSDDEDFLTIRTEAEELMNDFADDVYQEISQAAPPTNPPSTPPISARKSPTPPKHVETPKEVETLPQIELKLPKRPVRERLGAREEKQVEKEAESPERFTPEREPEVRAQKSSRSRLDEPPKKQRKSDDEKPDANAMRVSSKVAVLPNAPRVCASVVRVRPRPRVAAHAPSNSLLLRAVADAHKSLLNIPPKVEAEPAMVKRALVKPMRRCVDAQKIVIQVQADRDTDDTQNKSAIEKEEIAPGMLTKKIINTDFLSSRSKEPRTSSVRDDTLVIETLNIHNPTVDKQKDTQFIVTMDGYDPNVFLAKKLLTEGVLDDESKEDKNKQATATVLKPKDKPDKDDKVVDRAAEPISNKELEKEMKREKEPADESAKVTKHDKKATKDVDKGVSTGTVQKKRLSDTSEESDTQVIINQESEEKKTETELQDKMELSPTVRKRKKSPIVFDVEKKEKKERARERTESAGSDNHVTVTTTTNTHKYDSVPSLSAAERALVPCRLFPACRYGGACAFLHPRCKFAAACTRRNCVYAHATPPAVASHVVPAANFKTIQPSTLPTICKFYPNCVNPVCHYAHPKPCRYGKACLNKLECNFYHPDSAKWRYPV